MHLNKQFRALLATRAAFWVIILSAPIYAHRAQADALPFSLAASNVSDALADVDGGIHSGTRLLDKLDLTATYASDENGALSGWSAFADLQWTDAVDFNGALAGTLQGISNIDAPSDIRLLDAWVARDFDGTAGIKAGIID